MADERFMIPDVPLASLDGRKPSEPPRSVEEERCDFCSQKPSPWTYEASHGTNWGACQPCYELIEAGDRAGLVNRSLEHSAQLQEWSRSQRRQLRPLLRAKIKDLHDDIFWRYCTTPPIYESIAFDGETQRSTS